MSDDRGAIDGLVRTFFSAFDNRGGAAPHLDELRGLFIDEGRIIRNTGLEPEVWDVETFIAPRRVMLTDGTLTEFHEAELESRTDIFGNVAQRFCSYRKAGVRNGVPFEGRGMKTMQFVRTRAGWKLASVAWDDETENSIVPAGWLSTTR